MAKKRSLATEIKAGVGPLPQDVNGFTITIRGHSTMNSRKLMTALRVDLDRLNPVIDIKQVHVELTKGKLFSTDEVL